MIVRVASMAYELSNHRRARRRRDARRPTTAGVIKFMIDNGMFDGDQMTVTGKTWAENVKDHPGLTPGQEIIKPLSDPVDFSA